MHRYEPLLGLNPEARRAALEARSTKPSGPPIAAASRRGKVDKAGSRPTSRPASRPGSRPASRPASRPTSRDVSPSHVSAATAAKMLHAAVVPLLNLAALNQCEDKMLGERVLSPAVSTPPAPSPLRRTSLHLRLDEEPQPGNRTPVRVHSATKHEQPERCAYGTSMPNNKRVAAAATRSPMRSPPQVLELQPNELPKPGMNKPHRIALAMPR